MKTRGTREMELGHPNDHGRVLSLARLWLSSHEQLVSKMPLPSVPQLNWELGPGDAAFPRAAFTSCFTCCFKLLSKTLA